MSNEYRPPNVVSIPFKFTDRGYVYPPSTDIKFRFSPSWRSGDLQASINILKLYQDETYSYTKTCPKYLIGYESGVPQLIDGRCIFGGIRDIGSSIVGLAGETPRSNLTAHINGVRLGSFSDLSANCSMDTPRNITAFVGAHLPSDISAELIGSRLSGNLDLLSNVSTHSPRDISAIIGTHLHSDVSAQIDGLKNKGFSDIFSSVGVHLPGYISSSIGIGYPSNLLARIIGIDRGVNDLQGIIGGIKKTSYGSIQSYIDVHDPSSITASIRMFYRSDYDLGGYLWPAHESYLQANISTHVWKVLHAHISGGGDGFDDLVGYLNGEKRKSFGYLQSSVYLHLPKNLGMSITGVKSDYRDLGGFLHALHTRFLSSIIDIHYPEFLTSSIKGWKTSSVGILSSLRVWYRVVVSSIYGEIGTHYPEDITSTIDTHQPIDLYSSIGGHLHGNLSLIIRSWHSGLISDISSNAFGFQDSSITSYIGADVPRNLKVYLRSWFSGATSILGSSVSSWVESPYLGARVYLHKPEDLMFFVRGWSRNNISNLGMYIHIWESGEISSSIDSHLFEEIKSSIRPWYLNINRDLMSRIGVWHDRSIGSIIDTHIWGNLSAKVLPHPPPPLPAIIKGWFVQQDIGLPSNIYGWGQGNLSAFSGGHLYGMLNIIMKGVVIGVTRDIHSNIYGWQDSNLNSTVGMHFPANLGMLLKGVVIGSISNVPARIYGWQESDLGVVSKGGHLPVDIIGHIRIYQSSFRNLRSSIYGWVQGNLYADIDSHSPSNILSSIRPWYTEKTSNIYGSTYGWGYVDIDAVVGMHNPVDLGVILKASERIYKNFKGVIHGWQEVFLGLRLGGTHYPVELPTELHVNQRGIRLLNTFIYAWHRSDLNSQLRIVFFENLSSSLLSIPPSDLVAFMNVISTTNLNAYTRVWLSSYLSAEINQIYFSNLSVNIGINSDPYRNLRSRISSYGSSQSDLGGSTLPMQYRFISSTIRATYLSDLSLYVFAVAPKDIYAFLHAWQIKDLGVFITGQDYPWNLKSSIFGSGSFSEINAFIFSVKASKVFRGILGLIHALEPRELGAEISVEPAILLGAFINPFMLGRNLTASIRPKMIRLTTLVSISTLMKNDLSAIINYPCFKTGYSYLSANIHSKFKAELQGIIFALKYDYRPFDLKASIGYSDNVLCIDKISLRINIFPSEFFTEDIHRINLKISAGRVFLSAFIRCTPVYGNISASIFANKIPKYTFDSLFKNRERVINKTYDGVFKSYEVVEMSFSSAVREYYYNSQGDFAWSNDRFEKWMLAVRSYIPADILLKLSRRLHKATKVYDLRKFLSVDEAIKFAIAYVSEYPTSNIFAEVVGRGYFEYLNCTINPRYVKKSLNSLNSNINSIGMGIVVKTHDSIVKL